jgi:hypothetical protein
MARENPRSTARIAKHPIHPILVPFPIVCFGSIEDRRHGDGVMFGAMRSSVLTRR